MAHNKDSIHFAFFKSQCLRVLLAAPMFFCFVGCGLKDQGIRFQREDALHSPKIVKNGGSGHENLVKMYESRIKILKSYILVRDGLPQTLDPIKLDAAYKDYQGHYENLKAENDVIYEASNRNCRRFLNAYDELNQQALYYLKTFIDNPAPLKALTMTQWLTLSRLQILQAAIDTMNFYIINDSEAGVGMLNPNEGKTCTVSNRKEWKEHEAQTGYALDHLFTVAFGRPGALTMNRQETALLDKIDQKHATDKAKFWTELAIGTGISILVWEYAPIVAGNVLATGFLAANSALFRTGMRAIGYMAEMYAWNYTDNHFVFPEDYALRDKVKLNDWEDQLTTTEDILSTPFNSPTLYYKMMLTINKALTERLLVQLEVWKPDLLFAERKWGSIDQALAYNEKKLDELLGSSPKNLPLAATQSAQPKIEARNGS